MNSRLAILLASIGCLCCGAGLAAEETRAAAGEGLQEQAAREQVVQVRVDPPSVTLDGPDASFSLLVHGQEADGFATDLTRKALYRSLDPRVAAVSESGRIAGVSDGSTQVTVDIAGRRLSVKVTVRGSQRPRRFNFENDIVPLLSKFGCNSAGCHGKAEGQNGFRLSIFGFDPRQDYDALTREGRGRRVFPASPMKSLLLRKISGIAPHGGGVRVPADRPEFKALRDWIAAGMPFGEADDPRVESIRVTPGERRMRMRDTQQLRVVARYTNGREQDVTPLANFRSNNEALVTVDEGGLVSALETPGQGAVMASYMGAVDVLRTLIPRRERIDNYPQLPARNFIDRAVYDQLKELNIVPSQPSSDAEYLRRVYLDVIGTLPTPEEARKFLADENADKRSRLVERLLGRPEFADYWALYWADLLRVDRETLGHKAAYAYYGWIRDSFAGNKPMDQFVTELLSAEGPITDAPQANFYNVVRRPGDMASTVSQVFLGVRIACAECHHHPFDRWSQRDYYGMQGFFAQVSHKRLGASDMLGFQGAKTIKHPRSGDEVFPYALGEEMPLAASTADRRPQLARWMTAPSNPWFARNMANRAWARLMGRGLVEPVDDVRATNPPTNPRLLDLLAEDFVRAKFDFHHLIRTITASHVYQLSSKPNATNQRDEQNYSRALFKRMDAEVLLDAVSAATGVEEKFQGTPQGYRAIQLWDNKTPHYFLQLFGRPTRATACECERNAEASIAQVLHLTNSPKIQAKISHAGGRVARLTREWRDDGRLVDELYLTFYSRFPSDQERARAVEFIQDQQGERLRGAEDLAWSMLNSLEFVFNH